MYQQITEQYFCKKEYTKDRCGRFLIDVSSDVIPDWHTVLNNTLYPLPALKEYLDNFIKQYPSQLAQTIAEQAFPTDPQPHLVPLEAWLHKNCIIYYALDDVLDSPIRVDIGIDTGDSRWEYTSNTVYPSMNAEFSLERTKSPSILWLCRQQRHKERELHHALRHIVKHPQKIENAFVKSLAEEVRNQLSYQNQLVFLIGATVRDVLVVNSLKRWSRETEKWGGFITISETSRCGFFSSFVGSTSLMDIAPEIPVKIPLKCLDYFMPDEAFGSYSVYSVTEAKSLWKSGHLLYSCLPKHFCLAMNAIGPELIQNAHSD